MTFDTSEKSTHSGAPLNLYEFRHGPVVWRVTNGDEEALIGADTYIPEHIKRGSINLTSDLAKGVLKITVPRTFAVAELMRLGPPAEPIQLTIRGFHRGGDSTVVIWMGRVMSVEFFELIAELSCESVWTSIERPGLRRRFGKTCPFVLYGVDCNIPETAFRVRDTATLVGNTTITAAALSAHEDGYFDGGYAEWQDPNGVIHRGYIVSHSEVTITLSTFIEGLSPGQVVDVFPGCDHTLSTCKDKFDNRVNFGGFPWIPDKNPMGGTSVF